MSKVEVLDCTLRDGGYCNDWNFGFDNIIKTIKGLNDANVDVVECGFLTNKYVGTNPDTTLFSSVDSINRIIPSNHGNKQYVAMVNFGEYDTSLLPDRADTSLDGIRVAFHKRDYKAAIDLCADIMAKGYQVYVQAMVSLSYSKIEYMDLIDRVNRLKPYAFYIVDSFGMMKKKDLKEIFSLVDDNLNREIKVGFHSHNNMQLSFSNAQFLADLACEREMILDSTVYGMGRGAGNLNTELLLEYLNENNGGSYELTPIITLIDSVYSLFYQKKYWGYSLPNYISAKHNAHPNYSTYLSEKNTLTVEAMDDIFSMMSDDKKVEYDKKYIEELYIKYMTHGQSGELRISEMGDMIDGRQILLIAPGRTIQTEKNRIDEFIASKNPVIISVNFDYEKADFIFVSNLRRFRELPESKYNKCIATSNIVSNDVFFRINYFDYLSDIEAVKDNAGLMAIKFLTSMGVKNVALAGFDGYSLQARENYSEEKMMSFQQKEWMERSNEAMKEAFSLLGNSVVISFITNTIYSK